MTFREQLKITIVDKLLIGVLIAAATFWLDGRIEKLKADLNVKSDVKKEQREEIGRKLSDFYYPVTLRLEKDNAIWQEVIGPRQKAGTEQLRSELENKLILANHREIISIIEKHLDMVGNDKELMPQISLYERHVAVYEALRAIGDQRTPYELGVGWPSDFYTLMKRRTQELQDKYDDLRRSGS